jgi:hypothetical protein
MPRQRFGWGLERLGCFRQSHNLKKERIQIERFLLRSARPPPVNRIDLLYPYVSELVSDPFAAASRPGSLASCRCDAGCKDLVLDILPRDSPPPRMIADDALEHRPAHGSAEHKAAMQAIEPDDVVERHLDMPLKN